MTPSVSGLEERIKLFDEADQGWDQELERLSKLAEDGYSVNEFETARLATNAERNRYDANLPNEHSRVRLQGSSSDYINANYLRGTTNPHQYIATQAPLTSTIPDFWTMLWSDKVKTIVMLARLVEDGVSRADQYWPTGGSVEFGGYQIELTEEREVEFGVVRSMKVSDGSRSALLEQLHCNMWPDHGVPTNVTPIFQMLECADANNADSSSPIVVHCSAGLGRTGTLIAIHLLRQRAMAGEAISAEAISETVIGLKAQRRGLIQSGEQLRLVYTAVLASALFEKVHRMDEVERGWTRELKSMDKQIQNEMSQSEFETALSVDNMDKNRYGDVLANERTRVRLDGKVSGRGGYINANYISGVLGPHQYIAAQAPLESTFEDFWRAIVMNEVKVIVMLAQLVENRVAKADQYWPKKGTMRVGRYVVELVKQRDLEFGRVRTLKVSEGSKSQLVEQLHFSKWPDHGVPASSGPILQIMEYMDEINGGIKSPVVIHCSAGLGRTGTFIAIHWLRQRRAEGESITAQAIRDAVMNLKLQRYGLVQSGEQYRFIYLAMVSR